MTWDGFGSSEAAWFWLGVYLARGTRGGHAENVHCLQACRDSPTRKLLRIKLPRRAAGIHQ